MDIYVQRACFPKAALFDGIMKGKGSIRRIGPGGLCKAGGLPGIPWKQRRNAVWRDNMAIKLAAIDLDGTLLRDDMSISVRSKEAVHAAMEQG